MVYLLQQAKALELYYQDIKAKRTLYFERKVLNPTVSSGKYPVQLCIE